MKYNIILGLKTYGKRIKINCRLLAILLTPLCLSTPGTNWIPVMLWIKKVGYI